MNSSDPRDNDQGEQAEEGAVGAEEDRNGHDGEELPYRSGSHDERTKPTLEHPVVSQDGQQGAKRGCRQADRDRHERADEASRRQGTGHGKRDHHSHEPRRQCEPPGALTEQPELELVASQEEEEREAHVGYQLEALRLGPPQDMRPYQDPAQNEDHHLRHVQPREESDQNGGQRGDQADDEEVDEALLKTHWDLPRPTPDGALAVAAALILSSR